MKKLDNDIAGQWSDHYENSITKESPRAKVILSACYLDELLRELIEISLKPKKQKNDNLLDGPQAPLSSFSSKIELTNRLNLISNDVATSLNLIRKIRNEFAHKITDCNFNNDKITRWNTELHKLNDIATEEKRQQFSNGSLGDFEKSVSWLVYWLKNTIQRTPTKCKKCGSEIERKIKIKVRKPGE